jgi:hypothetical protein
VGSAEPVKYPLEQPVQITAKMAQVPLLQALEGYTTVTPPGAVGDDEYSQPAIMARIPPNPAQGAATSSLPGQ